MQRVLVADDNKFIVEQIVKDLKKCESIEVIGTAKDGKEELELIRQLKPDVVVTDIQMPYMTGVEVIEKVKDDEYVPDFIVITGGTSSEMMQRMFKLPIRMLLDKPINMDTLIDEIMLNEIDSISNKEDTKEKIKVIIADDEEDCSGQIKINLSKYDEVEVLGIAKTDDEEIKLIEELKPDIVITDLKRKDEFSGFDIIKKYESKKTNLKFIIVSYARDMTVFKRKNVVGFVEKYPEVNFEKLIYLLKEGKKEIQEESKIQEISENKPKKRGLIERIKLLLK